MPDSPADRDRAATAITPEVVSHLAGLARINLTPEEVERLTTELGAILENVAKVSEVAAEDVPGTSHPIPLQNVSRPDVVADVLTAEQALSGAPDAESGRFRVRAILGEEQ